MTPEVSRDGYSSASILGRPSGPRGGRVSRLGRVTRPVVSQEVVRERRDDMTGIRGGRGPWSVNTGTLRSSGMTSGRGNGASAKPPRRRRLRKMLRPSAVSRSPMSSSRKTQLIYQWQECHPSTRADHPPERVPYWATPPGVSRTPALARRTASLQVPARRTRYGLLLPYSFRAPSWRSSVVRAGASVSWAQS